MKQTQVVAKAVVPGGNIPIVFNFETVAGKATVDSRPMRWKRAQNFISGSVAKGD